MDFTIFPIQCTFENRISGFLVLALSFVVVAFVVVVVKVYVLIYPSGVNTVD